MALNFLAGRKGIATFVSIFREMRSCTYEHDCHNLERSLQIFICLYKVWKCVREYRKRLRDTLLVKILVQPIKRPTMAGENNAWSDLTYRTRSWRKFERWRKEIGTIVKMEKRRHDKKNWWSMHTFILIYGIYMDRRTELVLSRKRKMRNSYEAFQASGSENLEMSW